MHLTTQDEEAQRILDRLLLLFRDPAFEDIAYVQQTLGTFFEASGCSHTEHDLSACKQPATSAGLGPAPHYYLHCSSILLLSYHFYIYTAHPSYLCSCHLSGILQASSRKQAQAGSGPATYFQEGFGHSAQGPQDSCPWPCEVCPGAAAHTPQPAATRCVLFRNVHT